MDELRPKEGDTRGIRLQSMLTDPSPYIVAHIAEKLCDFRPDCPGLTKERLLVIPDQAAFEAGTFAVVSDGEGSAFDPEQEAWLVTLRIDVAVDEEDVEEKRSKQLRKRKRHGTEHTETVPRDWLGVRQLPSMLFQQAVLCLFDASESDNGWWLHRPNKKDESRLNNALFAPLFFEEDSDYGRRFIVQWSTWVRHCAKAFPCAD